MNVIGDSSAPLNGVRPDYLAKPSRCQKQEKRGRGLSGNHTITNNNVEGLVQTGPPGVEARRPCTTAWCDQISTPAENQLRFTVPSTDTILLRFFGVDESA
jgi:hypothetical protein